MSLTPCSTSSRTSSLSVIDENHEMSFPPTELLVRDFGWPAVSPRYRGDHTPESNPDWDHDPLECKEAKAEAFEKMERSYALYMANLGKRVPAQKKKSSLGALPTLGTLNAFYQIRLPPVRYKQQCEEEGIGVG